MQSKNIDFNDATSLKQNLDILQEQYNNTGDVTVHDEIFDYMVDKYEEISGNEYKPIGAKTEEGDITLPVFCPSLDKIKEDVNDKEKAARNLAGFLNRYSENNFVLMDKYDGISVIIEYKDDSVKCYKRGNGEYGPDISFILDSIQIPRLPFNAIVRGEILIFEDDFVTLKEHLIAKGRKANNARNAISGAASRVNPDHTVLSKAKILAYSLYIKDDNKQYGVKGGPLKQTEQLTHLKHLGFNVQEYLVLTKNQITFNRLVEYVIKRKKEIPYYIDGVVLIFDIPISKPKSNENPKHAVAIKKDTIKIAKVLSCTWNMTSKDGYLTPVIQIEPTVIITEVTNITMNNARMMLENKIGKGSIIAITQGGDIIPKFLETIKPATIIFAPAIPYHWDSNGVDVMVTNPENYPQIKCAKIKYFIDTLGVKDWGLLTIWKLFHHGFDNLGKIIRATTEDIATAEGFQLTGAKRLHDSLQLGIKRATIPKIMAGSCIFGEGIGEGVMEKFIVAFPSWRNINITYEQILSINSFGPVRAKVIADNLEIFKNWLNGLPELEGVFFQEQTVNSALAGYVFLFTGFTQQTSFMTAQEIKKYGGRIKDNWSSEVNVVVAKDVNSTSEKANKARNSGGKVTLISKDQLDNMLRKIRHNN